MKIGKEFTRRGQRYKYLGEIDHVTRDGRQIKMLLVGSRCADCGDRFWYMTTRRAIDVKNLNRRCDEHKAQGRPVLRRDRLRGVATPPLAPAPLAVSGPLTALPVSLAASGPPAALPVPPPAAAPPLAPVALPAVTDPDRFDRYMQAIGLFD